MKPEPFRIEPAFVPRIWGARSLAPLFPEKTNLPEPIGEVWLTGIDCKIATGPFAGKTLVEAWRQMPPEWRGTRFSKPGDFPVLTKFIFPKDKLSIQVHPDDAYAAAHEQAAGGRGKTEMWHILAAEPSAQVLIGLRPGTTKEEFLRAVQKTTLERLLVAHFVQAGDTFFVPAGTPHTISPGMVLCEVQEYSDLTYRVYDYGRIDAKGKHRELHVEKALEVVNFGSTIGGKTARFPLPRRDFDRSLLAACRYFSAERWEITLPSTPDVDPLHFDLLVILSGSGTLDGPGFAVQYASGESWFLPANLGTRYLIPNEFTVLLRTYVPDLRALRNEAHRAGQTNTSLAYTVFD